jgi:hypothetical protein
VVLEFGVAEPVDGTDDAEQAEAVCVVQERRRLVVMRWAIQA